MFYHPFCRMSSLVLQGSTQDHIDCSVLWASRGRAAENIIKRADHNRFTDSSTHPRRVPPGRSPAPHRGQHPKPLALVEGPSPCRAGSIVSGRSARVTTCDTKTWLQNLRTVDHPAGWVAPRALRQSR